MLINQGVKGTYSFCSCGLSANLLPSPKHRFYTTSKVFHVQAILDDIAEANFPVFHTLATTFIGYFIS